MTAWTIDPETLVLTGPRTEFGERELDAQEWPPCPSCCAPVTADWVEITPLGHPDPTYMVGGWKCPGGCHSRITVSVGLLVAEQALVTVSTRWSTRTVTMPAEVIAEQAGLPANEIPGRRFTALEEGDALTGFRLVHDPRV